jgi:hypothetical protein
MFSRLIKAPSRKGVEKLLINRLLNSISMKKPRLFMIIILAVVIIAGIIFWSLIIFTKEFYYVDLHYRNNQLSTITNPTNLFEKKVGKWTDVQVTWKNESQALCSVEIHSVSMNRSFNLGPRLQYGLIVPKGEQISILFCGLEKNIYFKK